MLHIHLSSLFLAQPHRSSNVMLLVPMLPVWRLPPTPTPTVPTPPACMVATDQLIGGSVAA